MTEPGSLITAATDRFKESRDVARETAIALAAEREREMDAAAGNDLGGLSSAAVSPSDGNGAA